MDGAGYACAFHFDGGGVVAVPVELAGKGRGAGVEDHFAGGHRPEVHVRRSGCGLRGGVGGPADGPGDVSGELSERVAWLPHGWAMKDAAVGVFAAVVGVDLRGDDQVAKLDVVCERAGNADEQHHPRPEGRDGSLGQHGRAEVALTRDGYRHRCWDARQAADLEEGACGVAIDI